MSTMTLTGYENRVNEYALATGRPIKASAVKAIAKKLHARQARMSDLDLERVFMHSDATPPQAFKNIQRNDLNAARRLGLVAA
ncbi:hypothetical protein [Timonella senegalensis]|uniref:hypothetical protein n=1 Tax=Timonella senegalensis TaxID=1465825 RepID=UPI0003124844|nr:hypothetical protein [Timonella senegalensis]